MEVPGVALGPLAAEHWSGIPDCYKVQGRWWVGGRMEERKEKRQGGQEERSIKGRKEERKWKR